MNQEDIVENDLQYGDDYGECDYCDIVFEVGNQLDHCRECGSCWDHCSCIPKRTIDDNIDPTVFSFVDAVNR